ncbi:ImmA/IrrE family metallo-endopeptidase [Bacillus sp. B-jedd]|uniref:ImmA/IrrE family metallo-endopeptidase n=1 Tax=Bacillus sp. B-jedd TaxID=1476857 RepID=UPI0005155AB6|nr:ImmA/IrrE family metallo-endopeptidase [Bacillus sp. B-jedd]CEG25965.1 putative immunity region protein 2 [Bacillus sp. B-jedd]
MRIKRKVTSLINKFQTNDPFLIAEARSIEVLYLDLGKILGFYRSYKRVQIIHLNCNLDEKVRNFVCAHELGHAILHPGANTSFLKNNTYYSIDKFEREANKFAVELLLPDQELIEYQNTNLSLSEIGPIYGIPVELAKLKKVSF